MNNLARVISTAFIWSAIAAIMMATVNSPNVNDEWVIPVMALLSIGGGVVGTGVVWSQGWGHAPREAAEKAKRSSRIDRFLNTVDERELEELRARLMSEQDGEVVSLEEILQERRRSK
jgi:hypothetical protein